MRVGPGGAFHLTYCTNIHPGEDWASVQANLARHVPELRRRLAPGRAFGIGLRLGDAAARGLIEGDRLARFREWLAAEDLYVPTLNGFPYGAFHGRAVKDRAYAPDWRDPERLAYTRRLAAILAELVPEGLDGGISTVPLSYRPWFGSPAERDGAIGASVGHLAAFAADLVRLREERGVLLHLDLEPEPDCLLQDSGDVVGFYRDHLLAEGAPLLASELGIGRTAAEERLLDHVRLCYDACHFAVAYEPAAEVLPRLDALGVRLGRLQVSAALRVPLPAPAERGAIVERLRPFAESTYLHQTVERRADGTLRRHADLPDALAAADDPGAREWRIHFHVPVFLADDRALGSTQPDLEGALEAVVAERRTRHLEIETYTFDVLPPDLRADALGSIEREYRWVLGRLARQGAAAAE